MRHAMVTHSKPFPFLLSLPNLSCQSPVWLQRPQGHYRLASNYFDTTRRRWQQGAYWYDEKANANKPGRSPIGALYVGIIFLFQQIHNFTKWLSPSCEQLSEDCIHR